MKFRPLHDRVVVRRIEAEEKTKGGIIIPDTAKEKPQEGEVIAVGPGGRDESGKLTPIDLKVGDRILFGKWSGTEIKLDGEELLIMKESDVMGVVQSSSGDKSAGASPQEGLTPDRSKGEEGSRRRRAQRHPRRCRGGHPAGRRRAPPARGQGARGDEGRQRRSAHRG